MPPPELAADAPVLDVVHPLEIGLRPVVGNEADAPVLDGGDGRRRQRRDLHVPLVGEPGFEHGIAAIAARHRQRVRFHLLEQAGILHQRHDLAAGLEAIEADQRGGYLARRQRAAGVVAGGDARIAIHDVDQRQVVAAADLVVVEVVAGGDLDAAGTEGRVDVGVGDDRHQATGERQAHLAADQVAVALVLGIHRHRGVAQQGLRTGRCHDQVAAAVGERVAEVPELSLLGLGDHLEIRQRGVQHGVPVDQALAAVDQPFLVQRDEDLGDRGRQPLVHGEAVAAPVHRVAQPAHLPADGAPRLLFPFPDPGDEGLAADVGATLAGGVELAFHHHLGGDAGVVRARLPQCAVTAHAVVARERVHERVLEGVAHVQRAGDVRRRDHDAVGGAAARWRKQAAPLPFLVEALLDAGGVVGLLHAHALCFPSGGPCRGRNVPAARRRSGRAARCAAGR